MSKNEQQRFIPVPAFSHTDLVLDWVPANERPRKPDDHHKKLT